MPELSTQPTALIILGVHRSGTSALTGLMDLLGWQSPAHQIPKLPQNPKGFFESRPAARLNDALLEHFDQTWRDLRPNPVFDGALPWLEEEKARARTLIEEEFGEVPFLVFKDPRLCRLLPFWKEVFEDARTPVKAIFTMRHPKEVAQSLKVRNGLSPSHGMLLWIADTLRAEHASRGMPRAFTSYPRLLEEPKAELKRLITLLDLPFKDRVSKRSKQIDGFLDAGLRHHATPKEAGLRRPLLEVFTILSEWSTTGENPRDHAALDEIRIYLESIIAHAATAQINDNRRINMLYSALTLLSTSRGGGLFDQEQSRFVRIVSELAIAGLDAVSER